MRRQNVRMFIIIIHTDQGVEGVGLSLQLGKHVEAETRFSRRNAFRAERQNRTLSLAREIHAAGISRWTWWKKRSIRECTAGVSRRSSAVEVLKVARRSAGGLGITEEAIPVIKIGLRHAFFVAHLAWPLSRCAVQNGIFYVCESDDHQTKMHLGDCSHGGCSTHSFLSFFPFETRIPNPLIYSLPIALSVLSVIYFCNEESQEYLR